MRRRTYGWLLVIVALSLLSISHRSAASVTRQVEQAVVTRRGYLPLIARPLVATATFGTAVDQNGRPTPPLTTIGPGQRKLYYNVGVQGAAGLPYRIEYILPSGALTPDQGSFASNDVNAPGLICYTSGLDCENPSATLQPGSYTIRVFISNQLIGESSVTVLAGLDQAAAPNGPPAVRR